MKRTSFVCFGAQGNKDSLVYQEIPGRDGGEEFFLFFSPGEPAQEPLLRTLFREAVSASRLGAPEHYFTRFIAQFRAQTEGAAGDGDVIAGALIMIQIRRGDDVYLLSNRDAELVHWDGGSGWRHPAESLRGVSEVALGDGNNQRDLFSRAAEDLFVVNHFTIGEGEHTLILAPSADFVARHAESLRNSVFFPAFEFPREMGIELAVARSFPALRWKSEAREEAAPDDRTVARPRRPRTPVIAAGLAAALLVVIFLGPLLKHYRSPASRQPSALLGASDAVKPDSTASGAPPLRPAAGPQPPAQINRPAQLALTEAWRADLKGAATSSPCPYEGKVYIGCRDGSLYAYTSEGNLAWSYRSGAGVGASPCLSGRRVVCANYRGDLFCLDANTGAAIWSFAARSKIVSGPQARENLVVAGTVDGRIVAVRSDNGRRLWQRKIGASIVASPAVGPDYVIAATTDGFLVRLDLRGKIVWRVNAGGGILSSPLCIEERNLVVFGGGRYVNGYSLTGGKRIWRLSAGSAVDGAPSRGGDVIFVGTNNGNLCALTFDGVQLWRCQVGGAVHSRPLVAGTVVLVTTYASRLVAVDAASGKIAGEFHAASPAYSSPASDGTRVYFGSNSGVLHAVWLKVPVAS
jgi:outer membrane protein assembly factor BamB